MDAILQTSFFNTFLMTEDLCIVIEISLKFVPMVPIDSGV